MSLALRIDQVLVSQSLFRRTELTILLCRKRGGTNSGLPQTWHKSILAVQTDFAFFTVAELVAGRLCVQF